jgi:hypothetical protein
MASFSLLAAGATGLLPVLASYLAPAPSPAPSFTSGLYQQGSPPPPTAFGTIQPAIPPGGMLVVSVPPSVQKRGPGNPPNPVVQTQLVQPASTTSPLRVLNPDTSGAINFKFKDGKCGAYVLISSTSGLVQDVDTQLVLRDRQGAPLSSAHIVAPAPHQTFTMQPYETAVQFIQIEFAQAPQADRHAGMPAGQGHGSASPTLAGNTLLPATGLLRFLATPHYNAATAKCKPKPADNPCQGRPNPGFLDQALVITEPPLPSATRVGYIVGVDLLVSVVVVAITCISLSRKKISLLRRMGGATWTFGQSWGANVTIGAGLLGTFLTLVAFPEHPQILDKGSYTLLQALFAALIALAPLVYGLFRRDVQANINGVATTDSQGYVMMFLFAGGLVLWAALGQLTSLGVLIREFVLGEGLAPFTGNILEALVLILWLLLVVYALHSLYLTAKQLSADKSEAQGPQPPQLLPLGMPLPAPTASALKPPLHPWTFL